MRPLTVKEIVAAVPVGQSTVSEHLRQLAAVRFVLAEDRGTSRLYRINDACVSCFPTAADLVMGKPSPVPPRRMTMVSADRDEIRAAVAARYASLARAAQAGQAITDGDPDGGLQCSRVPRHRRPARGGGAGQPGLRQPGRGR